MMTVYERARELSPDEMKLLHAELGKMNPVKDLFTGRGSHLGCGECCSRMLPMTEGELRAIRKAVAERGIELRPEQAEIDFLCPLLSDDMTCMAYDARPLICRLYDCSEHSRGIVKMHPLMGRCEIVDLREELR